MIKLIRNNWAQAGVFIDPDGKEVKWEYIAELHKLQENEGLYLGNKLRKKHMEWRKAIMKVIYLTFYFSIHEMSIFLKFALSAQQLMVFINFR